MIVLSSLEHALSNLGNMCVHVHVCVCVCVCVCVYEVGGREMLVRHLCVLHVSFWCLELCVFDCLLCALWAQLRRGAQRKHYYHYICYIH